MMRLSEVLVHVATRLFLRVIVWIKGKRWMYICFLCREYSEKSVNIYKKTNIATLPTRKVIRNKNKPVAFQSSPETFSALHTSLT